MSGALCILDVYLRPAAKNKRRLVATERLLSSVRLESNIRVVIEKNALSKSFVSVFLEVLIACL